MSDTSVGSTEPARVRASPPEGSQIAMWLDAASTVQLCEYSYPANAIIDVVYDIVVRDDGTNELVTASVSGAGAGSNYVRALDSLTGVNVIPVDYPTI